MIPVGHTGCAEMSEMLQNYRFVSLDIKNCQNASRVPLSDSVTASKEPLDVQGSRDVYWAFTRP